MNERENSERFVLTPRSSHMAEIHVLGVRVPTAVVELAIAEVAVDEALDVGPRDGEAQGSGDQREIGRELAADYIVYDLRRPDNTAMRFDAKVDRNALAKRMEARGVAVRPYFLPIHLQPYMQERFGYREGDFPVTEDLGKRGLALPFSGVMTEAQVENVCQAIHAELHKSN